MKQGTQFALPVEIGMSLDEVSRIEFVFKQKSCKGFPAIKTNVWPDDCTRQEGQNIILIPWTRAETYKFMGGTWERISERFLLGASGSFPAGATGGESAHTLTQSELPNYSLSVTNGSNVIRSKTGSSADAYVQTQSGGWGIPNWESKTVTVASGGSGKAHNNMPPYLAVYMWKRTK